MTATADTLPTITAMTPVDRAATEAYLAELEKEFRENTAEMWTAKGNGDDDEYRRAVDTNRRLYREIAEVEFALRTGFLPF